MKGHARGSLAIALIVVAMGSGLAHWVRPSASSPDGPNVLIVVTDDQRAMHTMPVMAKTRRWYANDGRRFTNAFATTPVCCPARASIFSGRYAHNHRTLTNADGEAIKLDQETTLQRYLHDAGYTTAMIGRYLNGWPDGTAPPHFDRFARCGCPYFDAVVEEEDGAHRIEGYTTHFIREWVVDTLRAMEQDDERPWLLYVAPKAPHNRPEPEPRYASAAVPLPPPTPAMRERDLNDKPWWVRKRKKRPPHETRERQLRALMSVDDLIDGIFRELGRLGEGYDTLAFVLSDNGFLWGEHGLHGKGAPYGPSVRIPMLMRWPARIRSGIDERLVANIDVAPTVLDAAGIEPARPMDGTSLLRPGSRRRLLLEMFGSDARTNLRWASTITRRFQYIEYLSPTGTGIAREYYDLRGDPWQLRNLLRDESPDNDPRLAPLSRRLARDRRCEGESCP